MKVVASIGAVEREREKEREMSLFRAVGFLQPTVGYEDDACYELSAEDNVAIKRRGFDSR